MNHITTIVGSEPAASPATISRDGNRPSSRRSKSMNTIVSNSHIDKSVPVDVSIAPEIEGGIECQDDPIFAAIERVVRATKKNNETLKQYDKARFAAERQFGKQPDTLQAEQKWARRAGLTELGAATERCAEEWSNAAKAFFATRPSTPRGWAASLRELRAAGTLQCKGATEVMIKDLEIFLDHSRLRNRPRFESMFDMECPLNEADRLIRGVERLFLEHCAENCNLEGAVFKEVMSCLISKVQTEISVVLKIFNGACAVQDRR